MLAEEKITETQTEWYLKTEIRAKTENCFLRLSKRIMNTFYSLRYHFHHILIQCTRHQCVSLVITQSHFNHIVQSPKFR